MYIAAAINVSGKAIPAVQALSRSTPPRPGNGNLIKMVVTDMEDATPLTLGQEWLGYAGMLADNIGRIEDALKGVDHLALGGTAVGTGLNAAPGFAEAAAAEIAALTGLPFVSAPTSHTVQGNHDALVQLSSCTRRRWPCHYTKSPTISDSCPAGRELFAELSDPGDQLGPSIMLGRRTAPRPEAG